MNKEDKYSLGYAICDSIQENKDKIEKLENKLKRCRKKKTQVENKCSDYKCRIEKATNYYLKTLAKNGSMPDEAVEMFNLLEENKR